MRAASFGPHHGNSKSLAHGGYLDKAASERRWPGRAPRSCKARPVATCLEAGNGQALQPRRAVGACCKRRGDKLHKKRGDGCSKAKLRARVRAACIIKGSVVSRLAQVCCGK